MIDHWKDLWGVIDQIHLTLNFIIIISCLPNEPWINIQVLRIMAAFAMCATLGKGYDWMRLFEKTSFYILLIQETIKDVSPFLLLLMISLLMFGFPMIMLDLLDTGEETLLIERLSGSIVFDLILNQYYLALGEYRTDNFHDAPATLLCFVFFMLATFCTQVVLLNMLIAIMGDTFERVTEHKELNGRRTKLDLLGDFAGMLKEEKQDPACFLYVIQPKLDDDDMGKGW